MDLSVSFGNIVLKNPLVVASGDVGLDMKLHYRMVDAGPGAIVTKSATDIQELQSASITAYKVLDKEEHNFTMLSRGGPMMELEKWLELAPEWVSYAHKHGTKLIGSISCTSPDNWIIYAKAAEQTGIDMLELNLGCPFGGASDKAGGFLLGQSKEASAEIIGIVKKSVKVPIIAKLTPQVDDLVPFAKSAIAAGASAVHIMHRYSGFRVDIETGEPLLGGVSGVGGSWMKSLTLAWISKTYNQGVGPIFGANGVGSWQDAVEFLMAGANAVQFTSVLMVKGPDYIKEMLAGLEGFLNRKKYKSVRDIIGLANKKAMTVKDMGKLVGTTYMNNPQICAECSIGYKCIDFCYASAIEKQGKKVKFLKTCNGCSLCQQVCTLGAISVAK